MSSTYSAGLEVFPLALSGRGCEPSPSVRLTPTASASCDDTGQMSLFSEMSERLQPMFWPTIRSTDGERGGRGDLIQAIRGNPNNHYKLTSSAAAFPASPS